MAYSNTPCIEYWPKWTGPPKKDSGVSPTHQPSTRNHRCFHDGRRTVVHRAACGPSTETHRCERHRCERMKALYKSWVPTGPLFPGLHMIKSWDMRYCKPWTWTLWVWNDEPLREHPWLLWLISCLGLSLRQRFVEDYQRPWLKCGVPRPTSIPGAERIH